jgi:ribonucleoside-triphosphate reductase
MINNINNINKDEKNIETAKVQDEHSNLYIPDAKTDRTRKNIYKELLFRLNEVYAKPECTNAILKIHGMDARRFDFISNVENFMLQKLNDISVDDNSNKNDTTLEGIFQESVIPIRKIIGYDILYREMKHLYGKEEAKRLSRNLYDFSLALHDASKTDRIYCFALNAMPIVLEGRKFGQLHSAPSKHIQSYISALCETLHQLSNHVAGALAVGTFFMDCCHVLLKDGYDIESLKKPKIRKLIENEFQQFVHSLNHLSRNGSECFTIDTEVLTTEGFKKYNEVKEGDLVYTWKEGVLEIKPIEKVNIFDYDGEMHQYSGRDLYQCVTPNHRILAKKNNSTEYWLKPSSELIDNKTPLTIPVAFLEYNKEDYNISDDLLKLCTIILTDGCIDSNEKVVICKSNRRFGKELIEELLQKLNIKYTHSIQENVFSITTDNYKDTKYICNIYNLLMGKEKTQLLTLLNKTKKELPKWFGSLSKRQARIVLDIWSKFDGHGSFDKVDEKIKLQADNYTIANQLQQVAVIAGYGSTITERHIGKNKNSTIYVYLRKRANKSLKSKEKIQYKGKVWCPTTKNGIVLFRDKNKNTFISGNSPFTNLSIFDSHKLKKMVEDMSWYFDSFNKDSEYLTQYIMELQKIFIDFFDKGDPCAGNLQFRFPVISINLSKDDKTKKIIDTEFLEDFCNKYDIYRYNIFVSSGSKVASCCRLSMSQAEMMSMASQVNSFGGVAISLGSHRVVTVNMPRMALMPLNYKDFYKNLYTYIEDAAKILKAHKSLLYKLTDAGLQPFIKNGYLPLAKTFSTFGIIGISECREILEHRFGKIESDDVIRDILEFFNKTVLEMGKKYDIAVNIEQIPGESMAVRLADADRLLFGKELVPYKMYSNQFIPLWEDSTIFDRIRTSGLYENFLTGGSITHLMVGEEVSPIQAKKLIEYSSENGIEHFALNMVYSQCENNHVTHGKFKDCPTCDGKIVDYYTRVVGYIVSVKNWPKVRREWEFENRKFVDVKDI